MVQEGFTTALHPDVWAEFQKYHWPENFHELRETIRACVSASGGKLIEIGHIPVKVREAVAQQSAGKRNPPPRKVISLEWVLEQVERRMILRAMKQSGVNRANLADRLGMARATLLRRLKALGIAPE
jgi:DNA-binding NtrC family response regulator